MSAATKAEKVRGIICRLVDNLEDAIETEAVFNRANNDSALHEAYRQTPAEPVYRLVRNTLLMQLAMTLVRMHDRSARNRASLPHVFELLKDQDVMAAFSGEQTVVEAICGAREKWLEIKECEPLKRLREHRHRHLAHTLFEMPDTEFPVINDAFKLLDDTKPIVAKLALGVPGRADYDLEQLRERWWMCADKFWSAAVAGMKASKNR